MNDAFALLVSFCSGVGSFAAGCVLTAYLMGKDDQPTHVIHDTPPSNAMDITKPLGISIPTPKKPIKTGAVTRPTADTLEKKANPRKAEEEKEMENAFAALINSPHDNTMMMSR